MQLIYNVNNCLSYLIERYQRVTIDGASYEWRRTESRVLQDSVLSPILFSYLYKWYIWRYSLWSFNFADESLLLDEVVAPTVSVDQLNWDLYSVLKWAGKWLVTMKKIKSMIFSSKVNKRNHLPGFFPLTI